jgi:four helix bundle protein
MPNPNGIPKQSRSRIKSRSRIEVGIETWGKNMNAGAKIYFDHEKLEVYNDAITFVAWLEPVLEGLTRPGGVKEQLERASISIPLNIAEGNGKFSVKDRCRLFDIANGSALECASGLDVLVAKRKLTSEQILPGKEQLRSIVNMLIGLLKSLSERKYGKDEQV